MITPKDAAGRHGRPIQWLLATYAVLAALLMLVSARLWAQSPLRLTDFEFDYFLGLFHSTDQVEELPWQVLGWFIHLTGTLALGMLFLAIVTRLAREPEALPVRTLAGWVAGLSLVFVVGMPWISPDVFYYIGTGWLESHYGLNPYRDTMNQVPGFAREQMFANIFPAFLGGVTPYGPVFHKLAAGIAALSGGHETLALALHKALYLAAHAAACALVWQLAVPGWRRVALFAYGANPLVLFTMLTSAHNDHLMNLGMLASLWLLRRQWPLAAGLMLGVAFNIKYFPVVFVPVFMLMAWHQASERRWWPALLPALGFAAVAIAAQALYPDSLLKLTRTASGGIGVYRNSIYHLLEFGTGLVGGEILNLKLARIALGRVLLVAYLLAYPLVLASHWRRLKAAPYATGVELCLIVTLLFFLIVNSCNQEWYLTWMLGLAFILPRGPVWTLALRLSAYFLPLVIFTVNGVSATMLAANALLYLLLLATGGRYLWHEWPRRGDRQPLGMIPASAGAPRTSGV